MRHDGGHGCVVRIQLDGSLKLRDESTRVAAA
jgi:hypothetical protein